MTPRLAGRAVKSKGAEVLEHNRPPSELTHNPPRKGQEPMQILAKNQTKTKLETIAEELDELQAAGVKLAPNITPQALLIAEDAGLVMDLETGEVAGAESERYTVTDQGRQLALMEGA